MAGVNSVTLLGNIGRDPEVRKTTKGTAVVNFSMATTKRWKDRETNEQKEHTEWHRLVAFGRTAEIVGEYVRKGSQLYIEGQLQTRAWIGKEGYKRYTTEVIVRQLQLLGRPEDRKVAEPVDVPETPATEQEPPQVDDDIPF